MGILPSHQSLLITPGYLLDSEDRSTCQQHNCCFVRTRNILVDPFLVIRYVGAFRVEMVCQLKVRYNALSMLPVEVLISTT